MKEKLFKNPTAKEHLMSGGIIFDTDENILSFRVIESNGIVFYNGIPHYKEIAGTKISDFIALVLGKSTPDNYLPDGQRLIHQTRVDANKLAPSFCKDPFEHERLVVHLLKAKLFAQGTFEKLVPQFRVDPNSPELI